MIGNGAEFEEIRCNSETIQQEQQSPIPKLEVFGCDRVHYSGVVLAVLF